MVFKSYILYTPFILKDEVSRPDAFWIWKDVNPIAVSNSLAGCINQHREVFTVTTFCCKDVLLVFNRFENG